MKAATRLRARGPRELAELAKARVADALGSEEALVFLARPTGEPMPAARALELIEAAPADGHRYARDIGTDSSVTFRRRLSPHTKCFVVASAGKFLHATWLTTCAAWTREIRRYVRPPRGEAYVYESFTRAEARGKGVYPFALEAICAWLDARGVGRLWVAVEDDNAASLRAVSKAGFEEEFVLRYGRHRGRLHLAGPTGLVPRNADFFTRRAPKRVDCGASLL